ncbi:MAG: hypothetical protein HY268_15325 [Deltaproteobacteria bacterium]|nr:hypothetical protein [Deltaproteobacteria bacterium]
MAEKEYLIRLGDGARKRHYHQTDKGMVISFMVQLEVEITKGVWKPVIRYDCSHDFAHCDRYDLQSRQEKDNLRLAYADALNLADEDINKNWQIYKEKFLRGEMP